MPAMMEHLLRVGNSIGASQHSAAPTVDNDGDNEHYHERVVTLVLHDMGGIVHRRKSSTAVSNPVCERMINKRRSVVQLSKRVRSFGKRTQHSNDEEELSHDNMVSSAESDHPAAKIVIWCEEQHEVKSCRKNKTSSSSTPKYLYSCPIIEETIDDEGNVLTWSCAWTGDTAGRSFYIPLKNKGTSLSVVIGIQYAHEEINEPIGMANVDIGEDGEHFLSLPVESFKQRNRILDKIAAASSFKSSKDIEYEYLVSPSTVLNANLRVSSSSQRIFDTLVNGSTSSCEYHSTPLASLHIIKNDHGYADTEITSNAPEEEEQKCNNKILNQQNAAVSIAGSKTSKTVKATNMTCHCIHYPPDDESIESEGSVLNDNLAKNTVVIDDLFGKEADEEEEEYEDELKLDHVLDLNPIEEDDDVRTLPPSEELREEEDATHEVEISKERCTPILEDEAQSPEEEEELTDQEYEILDHKPLLAYIELEEANVKENDDEDSLTLGSFEAVETVLPTREERVETQLNIVCNELKILEQMLQEASDGVVDIINCGLFKENYVFSDDITCQTNCTSATVESYDLSCQSATFNGSIISTNNEAVNDDPEEESVQSVKEETIQNVNEEKSIDIVDKESNVVQRSPVRRSNSIFSKVTKKQESGSSMSLGRSPTSAEKELLLEKYNCDGSNASVYSV